MPEVAYLTAEALDDYLGATEKTRFLSAGGVSAEQYAALVAAVSDEVAGYVGDRALSRVPAAMTLHACAVARYRLYRDKASEAVRAQFEDAMAYLRAVQAGKISLPVAQPADDPATPEDESQANAAAWITSKPLLLGKPW